MSSVPSKEFKVKIVLSTQPNPSVAYLTSGEKLSDVYRGPISDKLTQEFAEVVGLVCFAERLIELEASLRQGQTQVSKNQVEVRSYKRKDAYFHMLRRTFFDSNFKSTLFEMLEPVSGQMSLIPNQGLVAVYAYLIERVYADKAELRRKLARSIHAISEPDRPRLTLIRPDISVQSAEIEVLSSSSERALDRVVFVLARSAVQFMTELDERIWRRFVSTLPGDLLVVG